MSDVLSHYDAICGRILREKERLVAARNQNEKDFRLREIASGERELTSEIEFLKKHHGIDLSPVAFDDMSDDELLRELGE